MTNGIYTALSANVAAERDMARVSNNLANADTTGFKRDKALFAEYVHRYRNDEIPEMMDDYGAIQDKHFVDVDGIYTDWAQGSLAETHNPLDIALSGEGFFKVRVGEEDLYQRGGSLRISDGGMLVGHDGSPVLDNVGNTILLDPEREVHINEGGVIYQGEEEVATLGLYDVDNRNWLMKVSDTRYRLEEDGNEVPFEGAVHQGFLESSNVNIVEEMTNMIAVQRHYEAASKAIKAYQTMDDKAVNKVGNI